MRTYAAALAWIKGQVKNPSQDWNNLCQMISRSAVGADAWAPSAREAFNQTPLVHRHSSWPPPAGSIAYWGNPDYGFGHATFVGDGVIYSNDIKRHGMIDTVPITTRAADAAFAKSWGLAYRGWIDATPSGSINLKPKPVAVIPQPKPKPPAPKPVPAAPVGSGPVWLYKFLVAQGLKGQQLRFMWAIAMRESGAQPGCLYPSTAPSDGNWNRATSPYWDTGLWQINNRHLAGIKAMFGASASMKTMLDPASNLKYALKLTKNGTYFGDWGIKRADGVGPGFTFDWSGWPVDWVATYSKDSEAGFVAAWNSYPKYAAVKPPTPTPVPPKPVKPSVSLSGVQRNLWKDVREVQIALNHVMNAHLVIDGKWGGSTQAAFNRYRVQSLHLAGPAAAGLPGLQSLTALGKAAGFTVVK